ncbi:MAG TPA: hypothetical protein VGF45_22995, partial [Polyangia bacterium]
MSSLSPSTLPISSPSSSATKPRRRAVCGETLLCLALAWGAAACSGEITQGAGPGSGSPGPGGSSATGAGGTTMPRPPGPGEKPAEMAVDPGTKGIHRLNATEYNFTVADVLGTKLQPANSSWLSGELKGYDNMF